jgi:hypothetical protein
VFRHCAPASGWSLPYIDVSQRSLLSAFPCQISLVHVFLDMCAHRLLHSILTKRRFLLRLWPSRAIERYNGGYP